MTEIVKQALTWQEFEKNSRALATQLRTVPNLKGLVGIARGGLVATAIIAHALNIRDVKTVAVASYHGQQQVTAEMLGSVDGIGTGEGWIFIDDLVDTGQTAQLIKKRYPKSQLAVVYAKPSGLPFVSHYNTEVAQNVWLEFPWE